MIAAWIQHLCLCAVAPTEVPKRTTFVFTDVTVEFLQVPDPLVHLQNLLELRHQSLISPQPFFPAASMAFASVYENNGNSARTIDEAGPEVEQAAAKKARDAWVGGQFSRGESESDSNSIVCRGREDVPGEEFKRLARLICDPLHQYRREIPQAIELPDEMPDELWQPVVES